MGNKFSIPRPRKGEAASPRGDPDYWRQEARQHAHRRNDFLEKSQQAYRQNKGAEAKALSLQGKEEARLMEEANRKVSEASFAANNASVEADFIDLHGLYVREAEVVTEKRIAQARGQKRPHLVVIVGQGHHSKDGVERLKPAIEAVARRHNIDCTENKPRPGCLWLDLPSQTRWSKLVSWFSERFVCI